MIPKLALLSGKGGSGKTTIALSLAKMLSDCGLRTLLIDCDIATNGATYFFEAKLENKGYYLSFSDLFADGFEQSPKKILQVDNKLWFVPSNISFPNNSDALQYQDNDIFIKNLDSYQNGFDVLIFDCQAGYSKILNAVLEVSTTNLIVLEPDAISSSSIRVLYAQVYALIEKTKTFQIFNKITDDEYSIYKQIVGGTTFNSLPPIKFNWEVRKAFAFAKIPEMVTTNVEFGKDVFALANILFPAFEKPLFSYIRKILMQEKEELELEVKKLEASKYDIADSQKTFVQKEAVKNFMVSVLSVFSAMFLVIITPVILPNIFDLFWESNIPTISLAIAMVTIFTCIYATMSYYRIFHKEKDMEWEAKQKMQAEYEYAYSKLAKRISEIEKTVVQGEPAEHPNESPQ